MSDGDRPSDSGAPSGAPWQWERKNARNGPGVGPEAFWCHLAGPPPELQLSLDDQPQLVASAEAPAVGPPRKGPHGTHPQGLATTRPRSARNAS